MKILIGVPCMESLPVEYVNSLLRLTKPHTTEIIHFPLSLVYVAREKIVDYAIKNEYDYVLFVDSDMVLPQETLVTLLEHKKDIVSGAAYMRKPPYKPCFYEKLTLGEGNEITCESFTDYPKGLIKAEGIGMACCLIRTQVFKDIYESGQPSFFPIMGYGEDLAFCLRARRAGYEIYVDTALQIGHIGSTIITEDTYFAWNGVQR